MQKKLIIFDLDGTLINTLEDLNASVNFALDTFSYPHRSLAQTRSDIGNGVAKLIERSIPDGIHNPQYEKCLEIFKSHYREHYFDKSLPYPQIKEVLWELKRRGYTLAVVSNKFDEGAKKLVNHFYPEIFSYIQGEVDFLKKKPSPEMIDFVIKNATFSKKEAIYIGDTNVDYESASNAGIDVILVSYGYRDRSFLEQIKNVPIIDTPIELLSLFA